MYSAIFISSILSLMIPNSYALVFENTPVIVVTQGVVENENVLPISVFWYHPNITKEDQLFVHSVNSKRVYIDNMTITSPTGSFEVPHAVLESGESLDQYCAVIVSGNSLLDDNPICDSKVQWMYDRKDSLGEFALKDLVIPGTYDSAAYTNLNRKSVDDQTLISRWSLCQSRSIKTQLMDGIRYLDLIPGSRSVEGRKEYIVTYDVTELITMDDVINQIKGFMEVSKDILIVSLRGFTQGISSDEDHQSFMKYLEQSFEKHAHPRETWSYALKNIWTDDKRLIISYDHPAHQRSNLMWPPITQYWTNAQSVNRLHAYLRGIYEETDKADVPHAAVVAFTQSSTRGSQDTSNRDISLRYWGQRLGKYILQWYTEEWNETANIIAVDFYQTSGIIDVAIQLTEYRSRHWHYLH